MSEHRVVVGVDGSLTATSTLAFAFDAARQRTAILEVVLVWETPRGASAEEMVRAPRADRLCPPRSGAA